MRYFSIDEIKELTSNFADLNYETFGFLGCLGRNEWQKEQLSKIDIKIDNKLPENMHYILTAILKK